MIKIMLVIFLYFLVFAGSEITYRLFNLSFLFARKIAHVGGSIVSFLLPLVVSNGAAIFLGLFFALVIFISKQNNFLQCIHDKKNLSAGEVVYPIGVALLAMTVWPINVLAYQGACLVFGFADSLAGYIGSSYGKNKYSILGGYKTYEGSIIFFVITVIIFLFYYFFYTTDHYFFEVVLIFIYATAIAFIESIFYRGWDNLVIPVTAGLALLLIIN